MDAGKKPAALFLLLVGGLELTGAALPFCRGPSVYSL